jgi:hypothetical protein
MRGRFVILRDGELEVYDEFDAIPDKFDNLIEFMPQYEPGPHTHDQHHEMATYTTCLAQLMRRETNASSD